MLLFRVYNGVVGSSGRQSTTSPLWEDIEARAVRLQLLIILHSGKQGGEGLLVVSVMALASCSCPRPDATARM